MWRCQVGSLLYDFRSLCGKNRLRLPPLSTPEVHSYSTCLHKSAPPSDLVKKAFCWVPSRSRYRAKGDPRFYYAPKGHTFNTSHDAKKPPEENPKRTVFPTLEEMSSIDIRQLYREMKPVSTGRNAFKRKWKRWQESIKHRQLDAKVKEEIAQRREENKRRQEEHLKELQLEWEEKRKNLSLPPSLMTYFAKP